MLEGFIANKLANKMFQKDVFKIVKRHALIAAIVMMFPLFGLDWVVYCYVLWHMYSAICKKVGTTLNFGNIATGFFVNIFVAIVLDFVFIIIPFLISFVVYAQFYFSGKAFIEMLKNK